MLVFYLAMNQKQKTTSENETPIRKKGEGLPQVKVRGQYKDNSERRRLEILSTTHE
jgi:hypothetical protein